MSISFVNPNRWETVIRLTAKTLRDDSLNKIMQENINILSDIYNIVPRTKLYACKVLDFLKNKGIKIGLVTHANVSWTHFKLSNKPSIKKHLDQIYIANENRFKNKNDWQVIMNKLYVRPSECALVGDNVKGDIIAGYELGIRKLYHIKATWDYYGNGGLPEGAMHVKSHKELLNLLLSSFG